MKSHQMKMKNFLVHEDTNVVLLLLVLLGRGSSLFTVGMTFDLYIRNNPLIVHKH